MTLGHVTDYPSVENISTPKGAEKDNKLQSFGDLPKYNNTTENQKLLEEIITISEDAKSIIKEGIEWVYAQEPSQENLTIFFQALKNNDPSFITEIGEVREYRNQILKNTKEQERQNKEQERQNKEQERQNKEQERQNKEQERQNKEQSEKVREREDLRIAKQKADTIHPEKSETFIQAQKQVEAGLILDESQLNDSPLTKSDIAKLTALQSDDSLWDEDIFSSDDEKEELRTYLSDGSFDSLKDSLGVISLSEKTIGIEDIGQVSGTILQPQRNAAHAENIGDTVGGFSEYVQSFGSFRPVFDFYQKIQGQDGWEEFIKQNQWSDEQTGIIKKGMELFALTHDQWSEEDNQRLQSNAHNCQKLLYEGLRNQSKQAVSETSMDSYLDTIYTGFAGGEGIHVDTDDLIYTKDGGMNLSLSYDGRYIGDLSLDREGDLYGPQILAPNDPAAQTSFESFQHTPVTTALQGPEKIFRKMKRQTPDRKLLIEQATKSDNPLKALQQSEKSHYQKKLRGVDRRNKRVAETSITRYITTLQSQKTNRKVSLLFANLNGNNVNETQSSIENKQKNTNTKITLPAEAVDFAKTFETSRQYYTKPEIERLNHTFNRLYKLLINRQMVQGSESIKDPLFQQLATGEPDQRKEALDVFLSSSKSLHGEQIYDLNAIEKYITYIGTHKPQGAVPADLLHTPRREKRQETLTQKQEMTDLASIDNMLDTMDNQIIYNG